MQRFICEAGRIVRASAGREAGRYFIVAALDGAELLLADGDKRTLAHPKRKNPAHVQQTGQTLPLEGLTDKALRHALHDLNAPAKRPYSKQNESRKEVIEDVEAGCN